MTWRNDFGDPTSMAALRARVLLATCAGAMLSTLATGLSKSQEWTTQYTMAYAGAMIFLVSLAISTWCRGARTGDTAFASMIYVAYPVIGAAVVVPDTKAAIPMVALCSMLPTTFAVLFVQRTLIAYVGIGLGVATITMVAVDIPPDGGTRVEYLTSVLCLTVISTSMRLVRDLAVSALVRSRQIEATDALTGLQNRRGLERTGAAVRHLAARTGVPLSALVLDLDHFKGINDEQGHAAGDEVLRRLGSLLIGSTRAEDVVARLGGEEFLVLSTCVPDTADVYAERLRRTIETELAPLTVSIGVHTESPAEDAEWPAAVWTMVNSADHALYRAKAAGRNQVATTGDPGRPQAPAERPILPGPREAPPSSGVGESLAALTHAARACPRCSD